jgi:hypothetical protein
MQVLWTRQCGRLDDHILEQLPYHLRREMLQVLGIPVVRNTSIFKNIRSSVMEEIVGRMEPRLYLADQVQLIFIFNV